MLLNESLTCHISFGSIRDDLFCWLSDVPNSKWRLLCNVLAFVGKLAKQSQTGTIKRHGKAYFKVLSAAMFPKATWGVCKGKAS